MNEEERDFLQKALANHTNNLRKLELQASEYGANAVPLSLSNSIAAEQRKIEEYTQRLQRPSSGGTPQVSTSQPMGQGALRIVRGRWRWILPLLLLAGVIASVMTWGKGDNTPPINAQATHTLTLAPTTSTATADAVAPATVLPPTLPSTMVVPSIETGPSSTAVSGENCRVQLFPDPPAEVFIESEDFGCEGEDSSYHDDVAPGSVNDGGVYRPTEGVDIYENAGRTFVGFTKTGEWLKYNLRVDRAARYTISVIVASPNTSGQFRLTLDDRTIPGIDTIDIPNTGAWDKWDSVMVGEIDLPVGHHTLTLSITSNEGNYDYIQFTPKTALLPPTATSTDVPIQEQEICRGEHKTCLVPANLHGVCALYFYRQGQAGAVIKTFLFRAATNVTVMNFSGVLHCWSYFPAKQTAAGGNDFATLSDVEATGVQFSTPVESINPQLLP